MKPKQYGSDYKIQICRGTNLYYDMLCEPKSSDSEQKEVDNISGNQHREKLVCQQCAQDKALQMKIEEGRYQKNLISYVEDYYKLNPEYQYNGIIQVQNEFNKQKSNYQTNSQKYYFSTTFYDHSNVLASNIVCNFSRNKLDKCYYSHQFTLHIPQQIIPHSG